MCEEEVVAVVQATLARSLIEKKRSSRVGPGKGSKFITVVAVTIICVQDPVPCTKSLPGKSFSFLRACEIVRSALLSSPFAEEMETQKGEVTCLRSHSRILELELQSMAEP